VIIDEAQRMPGLFEVLGGVIDRRRQEGRGNGRFLLLGSASIDLLRQSESLAGRIAYCELAPFDVLEATDGGIDPDALWVRGGFPDSVLAGDDATSERWRGDFIRTYLERDVPERDSGIVHALLNISSKEALLGHPVVSASWEGFAIENLLNVIDEWRIEPSFYRAHGGAEVDLVLSWRNGRRWLVEVKRTLVPRLRRGSSSAWEDVQPERGFVVYAGTERYRIREDVEAIGLAELCRELAALAR
jgi:predicted AAA+ superfamily ATPase